MRGCVGARVRAWVRGCVLTVSSASNTQGAGRCGRALSACPGWGGRGGEAVTVPRPQLRLEGHDVRKRP